MTSGRGQTDGITEEDSGWHPTDPQEGVGDRIPHVCHVQQTDQVDQPSPSFFLRVPSSHFVVEVSQA